MTLRPYLLAAVAAVLAALVAREYWPALTPGPAGIPQSGGQSAAARPSAPLLNPLSRLTEADFAALFDHPLFNPSRSKPVIEAPPPDMGSNPVADETPRPEEPAGPPRPVLMGTVTSPWPGGAYLGDDAGGPVVFLRPGQAALGLHLEEVHTDSAIFVSAEGEVTLPLQRTGPTGAPMDGAASQTDAPLPGAAVAMPPNP